MLRRRSAGLFPVLLVYLKQNLNSCCFCRMGHTDGEISAAFSQFDRDGNQVLDAEEQERMKRELQEKRV